MRRAVYPGSFNPPTVAHLHIARAALEACGLDRVDLALSRRALGKEDVDRPRFDERVAVLGQVVAERTWLGLVVTDAQLLVDIATGYDAVVMGADKWAQVNDPVFYGGCSAARDDAVARLPPPIVVPRPPYPTPSEYALHVDPALAVVSSSAVRNGTTGWMLPEAADFDAESGAWTDPDRYTRWRAGR